MKKIVAVILILAIFIGAGITASVSVSHSAFSKYSGTYANSQADTLYYTRDPYLTGLAFAAHFKDSVKVTTAIMRRMVGGELTTLLAGDTLLTAADSNFSAGINGTSANPSYSNMKTVTLAPYWDQVRIIVTYTASGNGVTNNKVDYFFEQQFSN